LQALRDIDLFADPNQYFLKLDFLKRLYLDQHNEENPQNLIAMEELLSPGLVTESVQDGNLDFVTFLGKEPLNYAHNLSKPDVEDLIYSGKYLYSAISAGVFPVVLHNPNIFVHDLVAHSIGHSLNPRYTRVYRQLSYWVRDMSYRRLTRLQKQLLEWFNEYYFFIARNKVANRLDVFPILGSTRTPKIGSLGYSTKQIKRFLIENSNKEEALELSKKLVPFVLEHMKPAGGIVSELFPQYIPHPLRDLIYFLRSQEDSQELISTEDIFNRLAAAQSSVLVHAEFSPEEVLKLIKRESSVLRPTDFRIFKGAY